MSPDDGDFGEQRRNIINKSTLILKYIKLGIPNVSPRVTSSHGSFVKSAVKNSRYFVFDKD